MQRTDLNEKRIHPLFPPLDVNSVISEFESEIYSDHLPILLKMNGLNILSYNIQGVTAESNLNRLPPLKNDQGLDDNENGAIFYKRQCSRYDRIIGAITEAVKNNRLDIIALQEVSFQFDIYNDEGKKVGTYNFIEKLKASLGEEWAASFGGEGKEEEGKGIVTFYKKNDLELKKESLNTIDRIISTTFLRKSSSTTFLRKSSDEVIHFNNIWGNYSVDPAPMEETFRDYLKVKQRGEIAVMVGDTNSRIAPTHSRPTNLTTGIIPPNYNYKYVSNKQLQVPDHPDGGFYADGKGAIHQLEHVVIDPATGQACVDDSTLSEVTENMPSEQQAVFKTPRAIMCLDAGVLARKDFPGKKTLKEYEVIIQTLLNDPEINVYRSSTIFNKQYISIRLVRALNKEVEKSQAQMQLQTQMTKAGIANEIKDMGTGKRGIFIHIRMDQLELFDDIVMPSSNLSRWAAAGAAIGATLLGAAVIAGLVVGWPVLVPLAGLLGTSASILAAAFGGGAVAGFFGVAVTALGLGTALAAAGGALGGLAATAAYGMGQLFSGKPNGYERLHAQKIFKVLAQR